MAMGFSRDEPLRRPGNRRKTPASPPRIGPPKGCQRCTTQGRHREASRAAHFTAFLCHARTGRWLRHPNRAGTAGTQRREHDNDLHSRLEPRRKGSPKPPRRTRRRRGSVAAITVLCRSAIMELSRSAFVDSYWFPQTLTSPWNFEMIRDAVERFEG